MRILLLWMCALCLVWTGPAADTQTASPDRYHSPEELVTAVRALATAHPDFILIHELAKSPGNRPVLLLEVGPETARSEKAMPAVLVAADLDGTVPLSAEAALDLANRLVEHPEARTDRTWYILPCGNPDAAQHFFDRPLRMDTRNDRPVNDDRDDRTDEDGPEDLNGDGLITMMRVPDPAGEWLTSTEDPRVMRKADWTKGEKGRYKLYTEGLDNDGDGRYNEDGPGGVAVGENFPHLFRFFTPTSGQWPGSEAEAFELIRFACAHPEIGLAVTFGDTNSCLAPPRGGRKGTADFSRIKIPANIGKRLGIDTSRTYTMDEVMEMVQRFAPPGMELTESMVASFLGLGAVVNPLPADLKFYSELADQYKKFLKEQGLTTERLDPADDRDGSFELWAYYQLGVPSFSLDFWTLPKPKKEKKAAGDELTPDKLESMSNEEFLALGEEKIAAFLKAAGTPPNIQASMVINMVKNGMMTTKKMAEMMRKMQKPKAGEDMDEASRALLAYSDSTLDGKGYVDWKPFQHPTLGAVEIGGKVPFADNTPPPDRIRPLLDAQVPWVLTIADKMPRLHIAKSEVTPQGGGIYRLKVWVENTGYLPYPTAMGRRDEHIPPVVVTIGSGATLLEGRPRQLIKAIDGLQTQTVSWLVQTDRPLTVKVTAAAPSAGQDSAQITVGGAQ